MKKLLIAFGFAIIASAPIVTACGDDGGTYNEPAKPASNPTKAEAEHTGAETVMGSIEQLGGNTYYCFRYQASGDAAGGLWCERQP